ncbi:small conductance mechanosensitive channel [Actinopolyspora saharensis]|uniref:Small conductance mechanosensitive channel n=1 Tax=Actinopolyspora saharensis TaxID=995062 RepID=A0A1H1FV01_9ACTN|nr:MULTISPECIES: mechanosensitive ion channel family protein [unclassified Actinopolyspora]SDR04690.1 small conductance mechanosensitive channel [Actinopolyspora saharensis]
MQTAVNSTTHLAEASAAGVADPVVNWFTENSGAFVSGIINILIILLVALVFRAVTGRVITHGVRRMVSSHQRINQATSKAGNLVTRQSNSSENAGQRQQQRAQTIGSVLRSVASSVIFGVAFVMILGEFGINLGPILASAGVLGLAIGFGAQSLVQDFLAGIFMMIEDQYGVGDVVDTGDAVGTVESVTLRITKIRDLNGGLWYVRNGEIMRVCNMNQDWANAVVEIPLDYSVDIAHAERVIESAIDDFAAEDEFKSKILEKPDLSGVIGIGNGSVTVRIIVKVKPGEQWALGRALRGRLKSRFDAEGVRVAYPLLPGNGAGAAKQG